MANIGTLTEDATPTASTAYAGGNGQISLEPTVSDRKIRSDSEPCAIILEGDADGGWTPLVTLYSIGQTKGFWAAAQNIRARSTGAEAGYTSVEVHVSQ